MIDGTGPIDWTEWRLFGVVRGGREVVGDYTADKVPKPFSGFDRC